ncbi:MAG: nuclear transport factor 2 family protein [Ahniella sp.]|nr:nuclear transport factor 2 family protein [Ahniella sp.]
MDSVSIVRQFWALMASNNFDSVAAVLHERFVLDWPQSGERIRGAAHFAGMNREYPAHGPWRFEIRRLFGSGDTAVSEVQVTDGAVTAVAISFFRIEDSRIVHITEYWPDPFPAPASRARWVELS